MVVPATSPFSPTSAKDANIKWYHRSVGAVYVGTSNGEEIRIYRANDNNVDSIIIQNMTYPEQCSQARSGVNSVVVHGGDGNDTIKASNSTESFDGPNSFDKPTSLTGDNGQDIIHGSDQTDTIDGGDGNDKNVFGDGLVGEGGNDLMYGGYGDDIMDGGSGNDTMYGDLDATSAYGGNDTMMGGSGADVMYGGYGDDDLTGGADIDYMYGGDGNDYFRAKNDGSNDAVYGNAGTDTAELDGGDYYDSIEVFG
jgi:Ca2+-binding RTX toxin-like protein